MSTCPYTYTPYDDHISSTNQSQQTPNKNINIPPFLTHDQHHTYIYSIDLFTARVIITLTHGTNASIRGSLKCNGSYMYAHEHTIPLHTSHTSHTLHSSHGLTILCKCRTLGWLPPRVVSVGHWALLHRSEGGHTCYSTVT